MGVSGHGEQSLSYDPENDDDNAIRKIIDTYITRRILC